MANIKGGFDYGKKYIKWNLLVGVVESIDTEAMLCIIEFIQKDCIMKLN